MSATAMAELVYGIPFKKIGKIQHHVPRTITRFRQLTGEPYPMKYRQNVVTICGEEIDDSPVEGSDEVDSSWLCNFSGGPFETCYGTDPEFNIRRHLKKKGWTVPKDEDGEDTFCSYLCKIVGLRVPAPSGYDDIHITTYSEKILRKTFLLAVKNFAKLGVPAGDVKLHKLSWVS